MVPVTTVAQVFDSPLFPDNYTYRSSSATITS